MTVNKILFIDDDTALLRTIERNLCMDFDLAVAAGGQTALELIESHGPFSVIVVDMRMPGMDGIDTIKAAREIAPNAIYMMLTGNQDTATAVRAVNDGEVFRYMNKPCEVAEIKSCIVAAQTQFEVEDAERELRNDTFIGSIGIMTDIIELQALGLADASRITQTLCQLASNLGLTIGWEERLAARICFVGLPALSHRDRLNLRNLEPTAQEHTDAFARLCQATAKTSERLPRLGRIGKIMRHVPKVDGWLSVTQPENFVAATLLRVAIYWNFLTSKGLQASTATQEMKLLLPKLSDTVCRAMNGLDDFRDAHAATQVPVGKLAEGMVTFEDIINEVGAIVVSRGRRLTAPIIERLGDHFGSPEAEVKIVAGSCPLEAAAV
jgi:ActR/RegA family two-component response regulator